VTEALRFPEGFAWGTATASYQIEGSVDADGRSLSIWDKFCRTPGRVLNGDTGDTADDHYRLWRSDIELMAGLGVGWYRFSLAWPRLQPDARGELNPAGLDFYSRLVDRLLERGIQPWVTLYHWDLPQVLEDAGGWPERDTALRFADYADRVHARLSDRVKHWTTLNEPWCSSMLGYATGRHAPGRREPEAALRAAHHLMLGHGLAVQTMRERAPELRYGITLNLSPVTPASDRLEDIDAARRVDGTANRIFLDPLLRGHYPEDVRIDLRDLSDFGHVADHDLDLIRQPLDVFGINYYMRHVVRVSDRPRDPSAPMQWLGADDVELVDRGLPRTEMGWEEDADGLHEILSRIAREYGPLPLYITENGAAYPDVPAADGAVHDPRRIAYLDAHLRAVHRAIAEGVDVRGYFAWSLLDNFEWSYGYSKRFGLFHVDYATQRRTAKDSAAWYREVIRSGLPATALS
jgi:beta-glucosidase